MYSSQNSTLAPRFATIIDRLLAGFPVSKREIELLLQPTNHEEREHLFAAARKARTNCFANRIFLYGFIYFSTYCRNDCRFCLYRKSNSGLNRYRKSPKEIIAAAQAIAKSGVHLIDLTMGEDPVLCQPDSQEFETLLETVTQISVTTGLPVMISPGALEDEQLDKLAATGVEWYACYQETHNPKHFATLRYDQDFEKRMSRKMHAAKRGMLIEEGILLGTGETVSDIADSLMWMKKHDVDQVRAMRFVPPPGYSLTKNVDNIQEEIVIAVMRLMMPDRLIPASLDVDGLAGLRRRLDAGANVITSIIPPQNGLAGVANHSLDIEENRRSREHIQPILKAAGLQAATPKQYRQWLEKRFRSRPNFS